MSKIEGIGYALPDRQVANAELEDQLELERGSIAAQCGLDGRRFAVDGQGPSDFATLAAKSALAEAGLAPSDLDLLIFATTTPDITFPGSGCFLQDKLGCETIGALDLRAQCSGFVFAMEVADRFLRAGMYRRILIATGEVYSSALDFSPAGQAVTPYLGDGGAAVILGRSEHDGALTAALRTDATELETFWCEFPSAAQLPTRITAQNIADGRHFFKINTDRMAAHGRAEIPNIVQAALAKSGQSMDSVDRFVVRHVYSEVEQATSEALGVSERCSVRSRDVGHLGAASLPIGLAQARERGEIERGQLVCLATAGAGMTSGALLLRF